MDLRNIYIQDNLLLLKKSYSESCLLITQNKAELSRKKLEQSLCRYPGKWPFMDKVFVLLFPSFKKDVEKFHMNKGPSMKDLYQEHQLKTIDVTLVTVLEDYLRNNNHNVQPSANLIAERKTVINCPKPSCRKEHIVPFGKPLRIECSGCNARFDFNSFKRNNGTVTEYKILPSANHL